MRFESVTAHAFGPFANKRLEFSPGMTVIYGPNESGKSTWHAVLYAGLCGLRRARGQSRADERDFADRHKPWDGQSWEVSARVRLDDGRHIELRHDLNGRADCAATDLTLGRNVTSEIINEGSPDGARWLGLDRRSFLATACVRQADILGIRKAPGLLQEHLQRAAATTRTDATATEAIARLQKFHDTQVGSHSARTKPFRIAQEGLQDAETRLGRAKNEHQGFLDLAAQAEGLWCRAETRREDLRLLEALAALRDAEASERRASRARELAQRYQGGQPQPLAEDDALARRIAAAIASWEGRSRVAELKGLSAGELQQRIDALPPMPEGDLEPHQDITVAQKAYENAVRVFELHESQQPPKSAPPERRGTSEQELRDLARDLEAAEPSIDPVLQERFQHARDRTDRLNTWSRTALLAAVGLTGAGTGVWLVVSGAVLAGLLVLIAAGALVAWGLARTGSARARALEELRIAESAVGGIRHTIAEVVRRREAARDRAHALGLSANPAALRALADEVSAAAQQRREFERWAERRGPLTERVTTIEVDLARALRGRGIQVGDDVTGAFEAYRSECAGRARTAVEAAKRGELEDQLAARLAAEEALQRARDAEQSLREAASGAGIAGEDPEGLCHGLKAWQIRALKAHRKALADWAELQALLAGRTLEEIEGEAKRKRNVVESRTAGLDPGQVSAQSLAPDLDDRLARLRSEVEQTDRDAERVQGQLRERTRTLPSVSEAEEEVERAREELDRVRRLKDTIEFTLQFLERAQDQVHRDIAPILAQTVKRWLPEVTAQRYSDATVDPETLEVRVRDDEGRWRNAALLSHGTTEQVYLLLRMAMAEHLGNPGETCPLVVDDVTVQSDRDRTESIMRCLHVISRGRQVIIFSQQDEILAWAQANLDRTRDNLVQLDVAGASR